MKVAVLQYRDLNRWDVKYSSQIEWYWDKTYIRKISEVLIRKEIPFMSSSPLPLLSIHFDGSMTERPTKNIKGRLFIANRGDIVYSKIDLRNGAIGTVPEEYEMVGFTAEFPIYEVQEKLVEREYIKLVLHSRNFRKYVDSLVSGTSGRKRISRSDFESIRIPTPPKPIQQEIVNFWKNAQLKVDALDKQRREKEKGISDYLYRALGISLPYKTDKGPIIVEYKNLVRWDLTSIFLSEQLHSTKYPLATLSDEKDKVILIERGKSPSYDSSSSSIILNQKCNRWNNIDLQYARRVNKHWLANIANHLLTTEGDIIINSTGEGTLGRASYITKKFGGLYYDSHLILLRLDETKINSMYFVEIFNSPFIQWQIELTKSAKSTKQTELGKQNLKNLFFPLPPKPIQDDISQTIHALHQEIQNLAKEKDDLLNYSQGRLEELVIGRR